MRTTMTVDLIGKRKQLAKKKKNLVARASIEASIRSYFNQNGFLEVSTPLRIESPAPELHIDPEPSGSHFLIASPELQMKQLIGADYPKIFQICKCFRAGERGQNHLPEFTMLEWYRTNGTVEDLMADCEALLVSCAQAVDTYPTAHRNGSDISLVPPFFRCSVADAFSTHAGWTPGPAPDSAQFDLDLVNLVEPALSNERPAFLTDYPASMASLAKLNPEDADRSTRFELYVGALELANGFEELIDPIEQRQRFEQEETARRSAGKSPYTLDESFLGALELGMPPCAGIALGVDRLVMLLTGADNISDVVPFP